MLTGQVLQRGKIANVEAVCCWIPLLQLMVLPIGLKRHRTNCQERDPTGGLLNWAESNGRQRAEMTVYLSEYFELAVADAFLIRMPDGQEGCNATQSRRVRSAGRLTALGLVG